MGTLMSTLTARTYLTPEEYLTWERKQPFKNEYHNGQIIAMSGASRAHNLITMNIANQFYTQLIGHGCEVYPGDMRVRIHQSTSYFYPDIVIVCDEPRFEDDTFDTLPQPGSYCRRSFLHQPQRSIAVKNLSTIRSWTPCKNICLSPKTVCTLNTICGEIPNGY